ncbi:hypothetical protein ACFLVW_04045 [Chloroflexota bacterium]
METLSSLYERIPKNFRRPIIQWVLPFIFGLIITLIWDVGTLLIALFLLFIIFFLISELGNRGARAVSEWSIKQYYKRIRGLIIFALIPAAWELIREISSESIIALYVLGIVTLSIWEKFDETIEDITGQLFGKRRRRRRRR